MASHYSIDFKIIAIKLYLKIKSIRKVPLLLDAVKRQFKDN